MRNPSPAQRCLKLEEWPVQDRDLWSRVTSGRRRSFRGDTPAGRLSAASVRKYEEGYGRWLGALFFLGELVDETPERRVTVDRLERYFGLLEQVGNRGASILGRFAELARALSLMYPGADFRWILDGGGFPIANRVSLEQRPITVVDTVAWLNWAEHLIEVARELPPDRARGDLWQDGLIIGCLGMRGMRQRTLLATRVNEHIVDTGDGFRLTYGEADMKCRNPISYPLPAVLVVPMREFLARERPCLLHGPDHGYLWTGVDGEPLRAPRLKTMIRTRSRHEFGVGFGTHAARHSLATSSIRRDPANPGVAAALLGATGEIIERHYNLGRSVEAFDRHGDTIEKLRKAFYR